MLKLICQESGTMYDLQNQEVKSGRKIRKKKIAISIIMLLCNKMPILRHPILVSVVPIFDIVLLDTLISLIITYTTLLQINLNHSN